METEDIAAEPLKLNILRGWRYGKLFYWLLNMCLNAYEYFGLGEWVGCAMVFLTAYPTWMPC